MFESVMKEKVVMDSIRTIKTPRKANKEVISEDPPSIYTFLMSKRENEKLKTSEERFDHIDQAFLQIYEEIKKVYSKKLVLNKLLAENTSHLDLRLTELQDDVGNKPSHLDFDFDAPSVWSTIGTLANTLKSTEPKETQPEFIPETKVVKLIQDSAYSLKSDFTSTLKSEVDHATVLVSRKVETVKHILIETARKLRDQTHHNTEEIDNLNRRIENLPLEGGRLPSPGVNLVEKVDLLKERLTTWKQIWKGITQKVKQ